MDVIFIDFLSTNERHTKGIYQIYFKVCVVHDYSSSDNKMIDFMIEFDLA